MYISGEDQMFPIFSPFALFFPLLIVFLVVRAFARCRRPRNDFIPPPSRDSVEERRTGLLRGASQDARIFKLAYKLKGRVTLSDIVVETGMGMREAEELIESMVDNAHIRMEIDDKLGTVTYEFPEIIRRFEGES
jgi:hypothetical protein